jgi:type VI secretion system protein ImpL
MTYSRVVRWVVILLLGAELCAIIWLAGPLLEVGGLKPLASSFARLLAIGVVLLLTLLALVLVERATRRKQASSDLTGEAPERQLIAAEVATLRSRMKGALLRSETEGTWFRPRVYRHPWYLVLGPSGSGKTAVLNGSGFTPAHLRSRAEASTEDWADTVELWVGREAAAIDTCGRLIDDEAEANAFFRSLVALIRRFRPQQPLNGILVTLHLAALAGCDETERAQLATRLRRRLDEVILMTGVSPPVYLILTGLDHVRGFADGFADLDPAERAKPLGVSLHWPQDPRDPAHRRPKFSGAFAHLVQQLTGLALHQAAGERDIRRRANTLEFPAQLGVCLEAVAAFAQSLTAKTASRRPVRLRGAYLVASPSKAAGEQPLDVLLPAMRETLGLRRALAGLDNRPPLAGGYFLRRLFSDVICREAGLVTSRMTHWRTIFIVAGLVTVVTGLIAFGFICRSEFVAARARLGELRATTTAAHNAIVAAKTDAAGTDLSGLLAYLDRLQTNAAAADEIAPQLPTFGGQDALAEAHRGAYARALHHLLLPRLVLRAEQRLTDASPPWDDAEAAQELFRTLKVYLMLGARGPQDAETIAEWAIENAAAFLPSSDPEALQRLDRHVRMLANGTLPQIVLDEQLITAARRRLSLETLIRHGFLMLQDLPGVSELPPWRAVDVAGPLVSRLLVRPSRKTLAEGIPGLYTRAGFFKVVAPALKDVAAQLAQDGWVIQFGTDAKELAELTEVLKQEIAESYFAEYISRWDGFLADLTVVPAATLQQAATQLAQLSGPASPLDPLYRSAARETDLDEPWAEQPSAGGGNAKPAPPPVSSHAVAAHFIWLRELVGPDGGSPSRLRQLVETLGALGRQLAEAAALPQDAAPPPNTGPSVAAQLLDSAATLPPSLARIVSDVTSNVTQLRSTATTGRLQVAWKEIEPFCRLVTGRYPFAAKASDMVSLEDFTLLLGPQGRLAHFFTDYLAPFVDRSGPSWRLSSTDSAQIGLNQAVLDQFQRAARIRDVFFAENPERPSLRFGLEALRLDARAETMSYSVGGQTLVYRHDPTHLVMMQWPAPDGQPTARLQVTPWIADDVNSIELRGPWAFLQLVEAGAPKREGGSLDRFVLRYQVGSRTASLRLTAASIINPFGSQDLRQFRCPTIQ